MSFKPGFVLAIYAVISSKVNSHQQICNVESSDFSEIATTSCFVDKTLMIEEFIKGEKRIILTSPRGFGKSTNLNMIKRFLEISVDGNGMPRNKVETANYNLFASNNFKIFQNKKLFDDHFGSYPVLHIDLKPLENIADFESMLDKIRKVLLNSFEEHIYLIENKRIWSEDLAGGQFIKYIHPKYHLSLSTAEIRTGFKQLLLLLRNHFGRNSVVLIDEYDSYVESLVFQKNPDVDIIVTFIQSIIGEILTSGKLVDRVILTGVHSLHQDLRTGCLTYYSFLNNHPFSKFTGLTEEIVDENVIDCGANKGEIEEKNNTILKYYNGYTVQSSNIKLFRISSVLSYLYKGTNKQYYSTRKEFISSFNSTLNLKEIAGTILQLFNGKSVYIVAFEPLTINDISDLNNLVTNGEVKDERTKELFLFYLYQLGYFSLDLKATPQKDKLCIRIPNEEVSCELKEILVQNHF